LTQVAPEESFPLPPMTTLPPNKLGSPDPSGTPGEIEVVRAALESDYDVLEELGRGGMAVVYRAREKALDREVAIKVLPASLGVDLDFVERFEREARTAGQLEHPNIVPIYRVGRAEAKHGQIIIYFVMKMLRGQSLSAVLRGKGRLTVDEVRRIMKETASALGFAARKGVVHRDIKPDNILLDDEGRCVVTDFGIAKTSTGPHTAAGTSMGTPRYMSPEHAQGTPVDVRSDIYSLGVVGYQCLAGHTPFDADNPFAILYKHINDTLPRPALQTDDEWALYDVIQRMLAKRPEQRFQTTDELLHALGAEVSLPTLTAAVPQRISAMVKTEVITNTLPTRWYEQYMRHPLYQRADSYSSKYGIKAWQAGAAVLGVFLIGTTMMALGGPTEPVADTSRVTQLNDTTNVRVPAVGGATLSSSGPGVTASVVAAPVLTAADSARIRDSIAKATAARAAAARAAEVRRVNAIQSSCPRVTVATLGQDGVPSVLVDSIGTKKRADTLRVVYDVCGVKQGTAFTTSITIRKIRQSRIKGAFGGTQQPVTQTYPDVSQAVRQRRRQHITLAGFSGGTYEADVIVQDASGRRMQMKREFQLQDR
jgi:serine/threonine protein kinase